ACLRPKGPPWSSPGQPPWGLTAPSPQAQTAVLQQPRAPPWGLTAPFAPGPKGRPAAAQGTALGTNGPFAPGPKGRPAVAQGTALGTNGPPRSQPQRGALTKTRTASWLPTLIRVVSFLFPSSGDPPMKRSDFFHVASHLSNWADTLRNQVDSCLTQAEDDLCRNAGVNGLV